MILFLHQIMNSSTKNIHIQNGINKRVKKKVLNKKRSKVNQCLQIHLISNFNFLLLQLLIKTNLI